ncbi:PWI domain-containing protein [Lasiosphaeria ovina]|uniref:PWI domain-containing protein n=1 Tax=Lasiosphaeria ovina TaxID=92902 RepID=A0AAE0TWU2_9PEZI|nr:PWI domain-containing protein [Lasiosphaeria ovina]
MATGVDLKLLKSTKFPAEFNQKVDITKVNIGVMKKWIAGRVTEILGTEDDVIIELIFNLLESVRNPDIKLLQIQLTGFLEKDTAPFCKELWKLLLSAQASPQGVPKELLEAKKQELLQEKVEYSRYSHSTPPTTTREIKIELSMLSVFEDPELTVKTTTIQIEADKAAEEARKRREELDRRDYSGGDRGDRGDRGGRGGRGGGRGGDSWRGRRDDRDRGGFGGRGGGGRSRSPPRYRDQRDHTDRGGPRGGGGFRDTYTPPISHSLAICGFGLFPFAISTTKRCQQQTIYLSFPNPSSSPCKTSIPVSPGQPGGTKETQIASPRPRTQRPFSFCIL